MKALLLFTLLIVAGNCQAQSSALKSNAESGADQSDFHSGRRYISVNGSAEKEVTPDIIYISVTIKEYFTDAALKQKVSVDDLEKNFLRTVYAAGINGSDISIESISGYGNWGPKRKTESFLASKRYQLKLTDLDKVNYIMSKVDQKAVSNMFISGYDYSKLEDVKKELRIEAMKNARTKAIYMIGALNESIGPVIEAEEQDSDQGNRVSFNRMSIESNDRQSTDLDFKKLNISSTVKVRFQIQ